MNGFPGLWTQRSRQPTSANRRVCLELGLHRLVVAADHATAMVTTMALNHPHFRLSSGRATLAQTRYDHVSTMHRRTCSHAAASRLWTLGTERRMARCRRSHDGVAHERSRPVVHDRRTRRAPRRRPFVAPTVAHGSAARRAAVCPRVGPAHAVLPIRRRGMAPPAAHRSERGMTTPGIPVGVEIHGAIEDPTALCVSEPESGGPIRAPGSGDRGRRPSSPRRPLRPGWSRCVALRSAVSTRRPPR